MIRSTKAFTTLSYSFIALSVITHSRSGFDVPRPLLVFICLGVSTGLVLLAVYWAETRHDLFLPTVAVLLSGIYLRLSGYLTVVTSGLDHGRWLSRAVWTQDTGQVLGGDMYQASPIYIVDLALSNLLLGGSIYSVRFVTILIASTLPILCLLLVYRLSANLKTGVVALVLTSTHVLYLRTATLHESESLAIAWFVLSIYFFLRAIKATERHWPLLMTATAMSSVMLHFFYSIVIVLTLTGGYIFHVIHDRIGKREQLSGNREAVGAGIITALIFAPIWMLWSTYAHAAAVTLTSVFSIPSVSSITQLLVPSSGASASSTGGGGGKTPLIVTIGRYYGLMVVLGIGVFGGLYAVIWERKRFLSAILLALVVGFATVGTLAVRLDYNLGFRLYYFAAIFAIVFAAVGVSRVDSLPEGTLRYAAIGIVVALIASSSIIGPLSPLGNNIDPRFGGDSWTISKTNQTQLNQMNEWDRFSRPANLDLNQVHSSFAPGFAGNLTVSQDCENSSVVGRSGDYAVCYPI